MGAGASSTTYKVDEEHNNGPNMNWDAAAAAATATSAETVDAAADVAIEEPTFSNKEEDLSVAHETIQMIFDILSQNGTYTTDEDSMDTVLQTAKALANHSTASANLMSTQRDGKSGDTLLHAAVRVAAHNIDFFDVVKLLLTEQFRFDINAQNWKGSAALHITCTSGSNSAGVAEVLLEYGAWTEIQDVEGSTPLILSAAAGDDECIITLLKFHAHMDARDFNGFSALDWAHHYCHTSSVKELGGGEVNHWLQYWDEATSCPYWYNTGSGESVWHDPSQEWPEEAEGGGATETKVNNDTDIGTAVSVPESLTPNSSRESKNNDIVVVDESKMSTPMDKWRNIAWKVGRQRVANKSDIVKLQRSPSRRTMHAPPTPTRPSPSKSARAGPRSPSRLTPSNVTPQKNGTHHSSPSTMLSPNHGAQIHRQIEMLMKMQADMQEEMRRRLDAAQHSNNNNQNNQNNNNGSPNGSNSNNNHHQHLQPAGLAAIEEQRVTELEHQLLAKDEEIAKIRLRMQTQQNEGNKEDDNNENNDNNDNNVDNENATLSSGMSVEEHEAVLVEARSKVEAELNKQKLSAENASKREKEAHEKEAEAMKKVEAMMIELKKKEVAITESRKQLADKDADKNETKKALAQQAAQLKEAKDLAEEHQKAIGKMRRQHSTVQKELSKAREQAMRQKQMEQQRKDMEQQMLKMKQENERLRNDYEKEHKHRRKLLNEVETLKGSIRVLCRIRPLSKRELSDGHQNAITFPPRKKGALVVQTNKGKDKFYEFDTTFKPDSTQEQVAAQVMPLVQSAIDGFNVCIFAYGQTGSGKTFTMTGADGGKLNKEETNLYGITPRSIVELFKISKGSGHHEINFLFSMVELYRGELLDLFRDKKNNKKNKNSKPMNVVNNKENNNNKKGKTKDNTKLSVKRDPATGVVHIENVQKLQVESPEELHALIKRGNDSRHTSSTKMNDTSSRSHLVMTIYCESTNTTSGVTTSGKLNLVDLAGSERQSKTGATGAVFEESKSINKSLSVSVCCNIVSSFLIFNP